jgi:lipopolysaccharide/colanic/teichoic acid biosynthesis glycosyltransferase
MLSRRQRRLKRGFDVLVSAVGLLFFGWLIVLLMWIVRLSTGEPGLFRQVRVGRQGAHFEILKLRTMRITNESGATTITTVTDARITRIGAFLRNTKLDELPQLLNVLRGEMSLVGPRPDVPEYVPLVGSQARAILSVQPGVTGPASLVFRDEAVLLARQRDPESYYVDVLLPAKSRLNEHYVQTWSFTRDVRYLLMTVRGVTLTEAEAMT